MKLAAEINSITEQFTRLGIIGKNAMDTQALLELKSDFCDKRRCLDCAIGNALLNGTLINLI